MFCVARNGPRCRLAVRWAPPGSTGGGATFPPYLAGQHCHAPTVVMVPSRRMVVIEAGRFCKVVKESRSAESSAYWRSLPSQDFPRAPRMGHFLTSSLRQ
ncbi:hypothetical protein E2C01_036684 [Portunus trituberculatus]|uniref:Uncharacterized protein n=1 Tax=Portunus trituberculatus TaxID=210409 RepID=A0A5B7FDB8_PORTR|nr:hypothetical protein [Portunus trituberculatus]